MNEKEMLKAQEELKKRMRMVASGQVQNPTMEVAKLVGDPFDPENEIPEVIQAIFKTDTVGIGEDYEYFVADQDTKTVTTVVNGSVTQVAVTPLTESELTFSTRSSNETLVYLDKLFEGKHDMLAKKRIALMEALDRIETYDAIQCIDTAVESAREFTLDTGDSKLTFPKIVDMVKSISQYVQIMRNPDGTVQSSNLVALTGCNVTNDLVLLDYDANKERAVSLEKAGINRWISVDEQQVVLTGTGTLTVMDSDTFYLIAPSKGEGRETGHFVRRNVQSLDADKAEKQRITIARGPILPEGASPKYAYSVGAVEQYGCVVVNPKPIAEFTRT